MQKYKRCVLINGAKFVCMLLAVTWLWEVSWGTNLSIRPLRICEKGSSVDEWTWSCWQRQKPVQRECWGLLFSTEPRWHWGHRGQYDPCDLHVMPLLQPQLLKVRMQLAKISRNEKKKNTRVLLVPRKKILFYWQQYICIWILQTVNVKKWDINTLKYS